MKIEEYTEFNMDEIKSLYDAVGWKAYTDNMTRLMKGYKNSLKVLAAFRDDELIGIIRAVGDGLTIVFIQDILVMPNEQRKGVGKSLLRAMIDLYPEVRQIELVTDIDPKTIGFYKSLGFKELSEVGCCGFMRLL
ncbi:Acetyltransferase (GNAT) family [Anaerococcus prevotii]|uniref:GCN5-related N-acetyltransferase n=1 Tax=Anaerococcus prevotii (strain ATCC 9321 / DSM 20548 / JCM 6508 / NCTC 11806 / PC1) TaxID=525919 RepID=C7RH07_ANAPD|nr:GNAT family N-acetyltransferase [Anaerococcus prevotii]ACV28768.1 GCN5-related N-acetyltransferase [Anaerococcus prevotii DSM 20548]SUU94443.1 Acetyltransferase (GNAT) family [Anaerococcus prevotii]